MNLIPDYPARPSAQEAIRTVFAGGALAVGLGVALAGTVAMGVLAGGDLTDALFRSAGVVFFSGFGILAMAAAFLAHHFRRRYQLVSREPAVADGGESDAA